MSRSWGELALGGAEGVAHEHGEVMGPTPPGTGVMACAFGAHGGEVHVARELAGVAAG